MRRYAGFLLPYFLLVTVVLYKCAVVHAESPGEPHFACDVHRPADYKYSRLKVMDAIRNSHLQGLTLVAAHRGYWEQYPENSRPAFVYAGLCYEIIEVDIKPARDGPVVEHDYVLNRTTNGTGSLKNITVEQFKKLHYKDRHGVVTSADDLKGYDAHDLIVNYSQVVNRKAPWGGYVLALDVKAAEAKDVWPEVEAIFNDIAEFDLGNTIRLSNSILFKVEARAMPVDLSVIAKMEARHPETQLNLCIVLNPNDSTNPTVVKRYRGKPFVASFEVNYPYRGSSMEQYLFGALPGAMGTYSTYYDLPTGVGGSGGCCSTLNTNTASQNQLNYRARWDWYLTYRRNGLQAFSVVTSDRPDLLIPFLQANGLRDTHIIDK